MNQLVENVYGAEKGILSNRVESFSGSGAGSVSVPKESLGKDNKKELEEKIDDRVVFSALEVGKVLKEKIEPVSIHTNMFTL